MKITNEEIAELRHLHQYDLDDSTDLSTNILLTKMIAALNRLAELEKANEKLIWKPVADGIKSESDLFMIRRNKETCCSHVGLRVGEYYQIDEIKNKRKDVYFGQWDLEDILNEYPDAEWREIMEAI